ncbi:hypothetical protein GIB67_000359 [Kingdonia uniflora]|uniref:Uncharacterized protein n=1 Tax=Kingdonia uniflora TaxID=39325 RepID=A0A7J7L1J7_9MAGN|nr:hypothetical protein GIB67_000359 [Kingdonia uniflora]
MVLEERIVYEAQRLKLKYFGYQSLEMAVSVPIPPTYRGLSREEAAEAVEDFYCWAIFISTNSAMVVVAEEVVVAVEEENWHEDSAEVDRDTTHKVDHTNQYKASDMESEKDASVLESRMVRARGNKCQPHEREKINSSSSSPNNRFTTKDLESNQRERWERENKVRRITPEDILLFYGAKNFKGSGGSYFCASVTRRRFFNLNSAGRTWNDNIIWVKGNCLQRDDEELMDLRFRSVEQSVKSTVERKESLLDEVAEEETELELVLGELGLSRKKRVKSKSKKVAKAQSARSMTGVGEGMRQTSGDVIKKVLPTSGATVSGEVTQGKRRRVEPLGSSGDKVTEGKSISVDDLKEVEERAKLAILQGKEDTSQMAASLVEGIWLEVKQLKATYAVAISQLQLEAKDNLDETAEECDRLGRHLMLKGYSQEEVDAIKANTYVEEEEKEAGVLGVVDGLGGLSPQTVLDNQGDDVELPEEGSEKVALDASRVCEDHALMCNQKFVEQFDRMKETNENREDQLVKEKDSGIKKRLEDFSKATERTENLQRQADALATMGKQADMAQYRIWALERTECRCDALNERVTHVISRTKKAETRERSGGSRTGNKAPQVRGDVISLSDCIKGLEGDVSRIQGHVQRGNADLRECQYKLDAALIREKALEGEIRAKELSVELVMLHARVVELQAINLAELEQYIAKFKEDAIRYDRIDADRNTWKDTYESVKVRHERLKVRFAKVVAPDVA